MHDTGATLSPGEAEAVDWSGNNPRRPAGIVSADPWGPPENARLGTSEMKDTPVSTWHTDNVLTWSALERMCRGEKAKRLTEQVTVILSNLLPIIS